MKKDKNYPILGVFKKYKDAEDEFPKSETIDYVEYKTINDIVIYADDRFVNPSKANYKLSSPCFILYIKEQYVTLMYKYDILIKNGEVNRTQINSYLESAAYL